MIQRNLVLNPSLEINTTGWVEHTNITGSSTTYTRATNWAKYGSYSMRMAGTADPGAVVGDFGSFIGTYVVPAPATGWTVTPGVTYTAQTWNYVNVAPPAGSPGLWNEIFFFFYDGDPAHTVQILQVNGPSLHQPVTLGEQLVSVTGTCPSGANLAQMVTVMRTNQPNDTMDFQADAAMFFEGGAPISYFDGSFAGHQWEGSPHASISSQQHDPTLSLIRGSTSSFNEYAQLLSSTLR